MIARGGGSDVKTDPSWFAFYLLPLSVLAAIILLTACSEGPSASLKVPPAYPGATAQERTLRSEDAGLGIYKSVEFNTADTPEAVLKFYRENLENEGWEVQDFQPDPAALIFTWENYERPPASYYCEVAARPGNSGITRVRVDLRDGTDR